MSMPEHLQGALHMTSTSSDDDEYWAVKRLEGQGENQHEVWDLYASSPGAGWPTKPFETVKQLPSWFKP